MTTKPTAEQYLAIACEVAGDGATVGLHHDDGRPVGVRITGCFADEARAIVPRIVERFYPGQDGWNAGREATVAAGFVCVWFPD